MLDTLIIMFSVTDSICIGQYLFKVAHGVSPTLNVNQTVIVIPCKNSWALQCCTFCHLLRDFYPNLDPHLTFISHKSIRDAKKCQVLFQYLAWMSSNFQSSMILICELIHKWCH